MYTYEWVMSHITRAGFWKGSRMAAIKKVMRHESTGNETMIASLPVDVMSLIYMCTMAYYCWVKSNEPTGNEALIWCDSFVYVTWLIHMCTMAHYCWVIASLPVDPCLITVDSWQAIRQWVNRNESWCTCEWVTSRIRTSHIIWVPHCRLAHYERWGAGVEIHFQEIQWALRPVVNGT